MIPRRVRIGGVWHTVKSERRMRDLGQYHVEPPLIRIRAQMRADLKAATLLHEILHGLYAAANLAHGDDEERVVSGICNAMASAIAEDPAAWRWVIDTLEQHK